MPSPKYSVSVAGVILNDKNEILIIQRQDNSEWQIPGGILELEESFQAGLKREIFEETALEIDIHELSGVYKNIKENIVALVFKCSHLKGTPTTSEETKNVKWLSWEKAEAILSPTFKTRVSDALCYKGSAKTRLHDGLNFFNE